MRETQGTAPERRAWWRGHVGHILLIWAGITVAGVLFGLFLPPRLMPQPASGTMHEVRLTVIVFTVAAAPVAALVWGIALYSLVVWRHRSSDVPPEDGPPIRGNTTVQVAWLFVSSFLTLFLLVWGLGELQAISAQASPKPLVVDVVGQQWMWTYAYPQDGGVQSATLVLPVGRSVLFRVTSKDVVHSFWIPNMGIKIDANPGVTTEVGVTPDQLGVFNVRCAELCGLYHAYMESAVQVVSGSAFTAWVRANGGRVG